MKTKLFKGAIFVTIATLLVKMLSIAYKIPYQNLTGDKGFYIYQQLYPVYSLFVSMGIFAFPLAISEAISLKVDKKKVLSSSFVLLLFCGFILIMFILLFNKTLGIWFNDSHLSTLFYPIIPVLFLIPVVSVIRGYLYSEPELINRVGVSQIIEQFFRVLFIIFILFQFKGFVIKNLYDVAKYSLLGFGIGLFCSAVYLFFKMDYRVIKLKNYNKTVAIGIFKRGLFLLISSSVLIILQLMDSLTIVNTLSQSININQAMIIKGIYDRSLPLVQTALFFVSPLLSSILPHIKSRDEYGKLLTFIIFLALPATLGMVVVTEDLNNLLFNDNQLTYTLQINSIIIILYAIFLTLSTMVKNSKRMTYIILIGVVLKFISNRILIGEIGIIGAPISSILSLVILNIWIFNITKKQIQLNLKIIFKLLISGTFMFIILILLSHYNVINGLIPTILLGILIYFSLIYLFKIRKVDLLFN